MDSILEDLKSRTAPLHQRLEAFLNLSDRLTDEDGYQQVLAAFYGFYAPLESELVNVADSMPDSINFASRRKTQLLAADLHTWYIEAAGLPLAKDLPAIDSAADALGSMYVLEGATLGGQIIKRLLKEKLAVTATNGGSFFTAYGERVREMWSEFREATSHYVNEHPQTSEAIVHSACETFTKFESWLREQLPNIKPDSSDSQ